jgi:hypothetical protein
MHALCSLLDRLAGAPIAGSRAATSSVVADRVSLSDAVSSGEQIDHRARRKSHPHRSFAAGKGHARL